MSSLFRRRKRKQLAAPIEPATVAVVADASVVVTTSRAPDVKQVENAEKEAPTATERPSASISIEQRSRNRRRSSMAWVLFIASVLVAIVAFSIIKQQQSLGDVNLSRLLRRKASSERPSFVKERGGIGIETIDDDDDDASASSTSSTSSSSAADEEELAAEARRAAESATASSSGPSGFISQEEWEEALIAVAAAEGDDNDNDNDDETSSSSSSSALASLEALIRARAGAAARGALLADAASLSWQGVSREIILETLKRCPSSVEREPEFFEGGENEEEGDEEDETSSSSAPSSTKCPLASSLPRSYPGEVTPPGSFSALGYETLPLLQSLMASNGFDKRHYSSAAAAFFSRTPGHVNALPRRVTAAAVVATAGGGGEAPQAAARNAAEDSSASSAVVKVAPLVARFAGTPKLRGAVAGALSVHQRSRTKDNKGRKTGGGAAAARAAAGAAAAVLERAVVLGESLPEAVASASRLETLSDLGRSYLSEVIGASEKEESAAALSELLLRNAGKGDGGEQGVLLSEESESDEPEKDEDLGSWDSAPVALKGALAASLLHPDDFAAAVRASMLAGGDASARAHLVGAFLGAATSTETAATTETTKSKLSSSKSKSKSKNSKPPPSDWRPRVEKAVQADAMIHLILHQRGERVPVAMPGEQVPGAE